MKTTLGLPPEILEKADKLADLMAWDDAKALGALIRIWVKAIEIGNNSASGAQLAHRARATASEQRNLVDSLRKIDFVVQVDRDVYEIWRGTKLIQSAENLSRRGRAGADATNEHRRRCTAQQATPLSDATSAAKHDKTSATSAATSDFLATALSKGVGGFHDAESSQTSAAQALPASAVLCLDASEDVSRERAREDGPEYEPDESFCEPNDEGPGLDDALPNVENLKHARALASACASEVDAKLLAPTATGWDPGGTQFNAETLRLIRAISPGASELRRDYVALVRSSVGVPVIETRLAFHGRIHAQFRNLLEAKARAAKPRRKSTRGTTWTSPWFPTSTPSSAPRRSAPPTGPPSARLSASCSVSRWRPSAATWCRRRGTWV